MVDHHGDDANPTPVSGNLGGVLPGGTVLLVDDEKTLRSFVRRLLVREGIGVVEAGSASEALELLETESSVNAIVSDVTMPGMTGLDLLAAVRSRYADRRLSFALCTGDATALRDEHAETTRSVLIIEKPFSASRFVEAIRELLRQSRG